MLVSGRLRNRGRPTCLLAPVETEPSLGKIGKCREARRNRFSAGRAHFVSPNPKGRLETLRCACAADQGSRNLKLAVTPIPETSAPSASSQRAISCTELLNTL